MKYFFISLGVLLLIIFGIVIFNNGGSKTATTSTAKKAIKLTDYASNNAASVQYIVEGPITALENHRIIQITVSPLSRSVNVFTGYQGQVLISQTFHNDSTAYGEFLAALNRAAFTKDRKVANSINPESICPTNNRTHYKIVDSSKDAMDLWSSSCAAGSFGGSVSLTGTLFRAQIPNYNRIVSGVNVVAL